MPRYKNNITQLFYKNNRPSTIKQDFYFKTILDTTNFALAETWTNDNQEVRLLGIDAKRSVLYAQRHDQYAHHTYSVYGHGFKPSSSLTTLGFKGEYIEHFSLLYPLGNGYRMYHPQLMRFGSPDSLSPFDQGGINCYGFCAGDPVNKSDRSGHAPKLELGLGKIALVLSDDNISNKISKFLGTENHNSFLRLVKQAKTSVNKQANKIAQQTITEENMLEYNISQAPRELHQALETRKNDLIQSGILKTIAIEDEFHRSNQELQGGRRGAIRHRPSATASIDNNSPDNENFTSSSKSKDIRDDRHNP